MQFEIKSTEVKQKQISFIATKINSVFYPLIDIHRRSKLSEFILSLQWSNFLDKIENSKSHKHGDCARQDTPMLAWSCAGHGKRTFVYEIFYCSLNCLFVRKAEEQQGKRKVQRFLKKTFTFVRAEHVSKWVIDLFLRLNGLFKAKAFFKL